jgi:hypothetical protein
VNIDGSEDGSVGTKMRKQRKRKATSENGAVKQHKALKSSRLSVASNDSLSNSSVHSKTNPSSVMLNRSDENEYDEFMDEASSMKRAKTMYLNLNSSSRNNHK